MGVRFICKGMNVIELFRKAYLTIACATIFANANAQTVLPQLDKQVLVPAKEVNIINLGDLITAQTGFTLSFNAQTIMAQKRLHLRHSSYSIRQLLSLIKKATSAQYTIYREHIIFHRITNSTATVSTLTTHHTARHVSKPPNAIGVSQSPVNTSVSTYHGIITVDHTDKRTGTIINMMPGTIKGGMNHLVSDSKPTYNRPYLLSYLTTATIVVPVAKPATPVVLPVTPVVQPHKQRYKHEKPGLFKPFVLAGFGADEIFYANLQAKAGLTLIYGIADWSSNFSISGFRYGAGSSYPLRNGWLVQLEATTGKLSKETSILGKGDTATVRLPLDIRSRLQRISLFAQKSIAQHISVYAGPVFNHLKSDYQLNKRQVSLAAVIQSTLATEKDYAIIKPPYTLSGSAPGEPENIKIWIGLQIGINYRF